MLWDSCFWRYQTFSPKRCRECYGTVTKPCWPTAFSLSKEEYYFFAFSNNDMADARTGKAILELPPFRVLKLRMIIASAEMCAFCPGNMFIECRLTWRSCERFLPLSVCDNWRITESMDMKFSRQVPQKLTTHCVKIVCKPDGSKLTWRLYTCSCTVSSRWHAWSYTTDD